MFDPFWLVWTGPLLLLLIGVAPARWAQTRPGRVADLAVLASLTALVSGPVVLAIGGVGQSGLAYIDGLSITVMALVSLVGAVVLRFSRHYLEGDRRHGVFLQTLALMLAAALVMIVSGNLLLTGLAWLATGLGLRRLLTFYRHRPAALLSARKNLIVSRLADICLLAAALLLWREAGSLNYAALFAQAEAWRQTGLPATAATAAALIALSALLKSAQLPTHGWLLEVMETPTPVSALLHAGIINSGGFLLLRLAPLIDQAPGALALLAVVGAATALFGSLVMLTQTSVKVSLAYSTVAQMGFMMLEIGLGAYPAALLHLVAHSLYKAHAFLSSGSVVELARAAWSPAPGERPHPARLVLALAGSLAVTAAMAAALGVTLARAPGVFVLGTVLVMGLTQLLAQAIDRRPSSHVVLRAIALSGLLAAAYFGLQRLSEQLYAADLPIHVGTASPLDIALAVLVIAGFVGLTVFQIVAVGHVDGPRWRALHAHIANGFYLNTLANRAVLALWPNPPAKAAQGEMQ
ncbi:MAG: NADH-quinone oxidoreductase subunit L [Sphingomonas sp.]